MALIRADATYMLLNAASRTVLDLTGGNRTSGTPVIAWDAHVEDGPYVLKNQQWKATQLADIAPDGNPYFSLSNLAGGTYLTLDTATDGLQVVSRDNSASSDGQKWHFTQVPKVPQGGAQVNAYT